MKSPKEEDWRSLLDRLAVLITPQEEAAVRQAAVDKGSPSHLRDLHNHVAALLVKHGLTTWEQLHASFPRDHLSSAGIFTTPSIFSTTTFRALLSPFHIVWRHIAAMESQLCFLKGTK